jgi:hypothetical protein
MDFVVVFKVAIVAMFPNVATAVVEKTRGYLRCTRMGYETVVVPS